MVESPPPAAERAGPPLPNRIGRGAPRTAPRGPARPERRTALMPSRRCAYNCHRMLRRAAGRPRVFQIRCGRSSVVERQLPKLNVVGSIPIARSSLARSGFSLIGNDDDQAEGLIGQPRAAIGASGTLIPLRPPPAPPRRLRRRGRPSTGRGCRLSAPCRPPRRRRSGRGRSARTSTRRRR